MRKTKRILAFVLAVVVAASCFAMTVSADETTAATTNTGTFSDVSDDAIYATAVKTFNKMGIINGYPDGTFGGEKLITRAEFAKLLTTAFSLKGSGVNPFSDVANDVWYKTYIGACYENGIINGTTATTFSPEMTVTREDASVMIYRVLENVIPQVENTNAFADKGTISDYAQDAIDALFSSGLIKGVGNNNFAPKVFIDRQSAAKLIYDAIIFKNK